MITNKGVIDVFGNKYVLKEHADHLMESLKMYYLVVEDWTGEFYFGINLNSKYEEGYMDMLMPE